MATDARPLIGWRLWRLKGGRLHSWVVDHVWEPGANHAVCLPIPPPPPVVASVAPRPSCPQPPGTSCSCGLWALWRLPTCLTKARCERCQGGTPVIGLVSGWGVVAVHGDEGFRCQHARILLLLSDSVWCRELDPLVERSWVARWRLRLRLGRRTGVPADRLRDAALRYGVLHSSLSNAIEAGILAEFGVPAAQVERARSALAPGVSPHASV